MPIACAKGSAARLACRLSAAGWTCGGRSTSFRAAASCLISSESRLGMTVGSMPWRAVASLKAGIIPRMTRSDLSRLCSFAASNTRLPVGKWVAAAAPMPTAAPPTADRVIGALSVMPFTWEATRS
ncbi:hypothetical protein D3C81_1941350 [compost metagenome]